MLLYDDVKKLFPHTLGIHLPGFEFLVVCNSTSVEMKKGLYIPSGKRVDLFESIEKGAIATLWEKDTDVPAFLPNHFPVFLVEDIQKAFEELHDYYKQNYIQEKWEIMTKFIYISESNLIIESKKIQNTETKRGGE
ncbi:hypothetical protein [Rossellomorea aquimaris]|uniref:hypothetical protein n=1 Tax=Rossellomorea aquimaris TaxID=189382 RepID=UPI0007D072BE|nr:hypothetical protein [Rossellomorea aquimaris]